MKNLTTFKLEVIADKVIESINDEVVFQQNFPNWNCTSIYEDISSYSSRAFAIKLYQLTNEQIYDIIAVLLKRAYLYQNCLSIDQAIKKVRRLLNRTQLYINENYLDFNDLSTENIVIKSDNIELKDNKETVLEKLKNKFRKIFKKLV